MRARWRLGQLLAAVERGVPRPGGKTMSGDQTSFRALLARLELDKDIAMKAQRIGMLPEAELDKALAAAHQADTFASFADLIERAWPFWQRARRVARHQQIESDAGYLGATEIAAMQFPLIYADPPWYFKTYTKGGGGYAGAGVGASCTRALRPDPAAARPKPITLSGGQHRRHRLRRWSRSDIVRPSRE